MQKYDDIQLPLRMLAVFCCVLQTTSEGLPPRHTSTRHRDTLHRLPFISYAIIVP